MASRIFVVLTLVALLSFYIIWRSPAPSWHGQPLELHEAIDDHLEILMFGDSGTGLPDQFKIAAAMERYCLTHQLKAIFMLGDNFYPAGVQSPDDPQWQSKFRDPYGKPCLSQLPFYAILGNHDYLGNPAAQISYSQKQSQWRMPHRFYSVQFGQLAKVIGIDTNILDYCTSATTCTLDFMHQALKDSHIPNRIVIGHHPISSASRKYPKTMQGRFLQQQLCNKGVIYISGHSHHIEHRHIADCGLDLFISGGGGASLYAVAQGDKSTKFVQSTHAFLSLKLSPQLSTFTFIDSELNALYSYKRNN